MNDQQALAFLHSRINYERTLPSPGILKLDRMKALLQLAGNPHQRLRIIHIAGSKGKGSTAAMIDSILQQAGYRTGLFTSPHLVHFEERIQVNGRSISPLELTSLIAELRPLVEMLDAHEQPVTFFELTTALGFLHFVRRRVDAAVVEVGLGGRFDSTNVCHPCVALITSISFDHTRLLGNTLARIAREKAGIVKRGVHTVSGVTDPEAQAVIKDVCKYQHSPLSQLGVDFDYRYDAGEINAVTWRRPTVEIRTRQHTWRELELELVGEHQAANAAVALTCIEELLRQGWHIPVQAVRQGVREVRWPARLEVVCRQPLVILDCAHNVASAVALVETLQTSFLAGRTSPPPRRVLVFAGSNDKDLAGMFRVLAPHFTHAFLTSHDNAPRVVPPGQLGEMLEQNASLPYTICVTAEQAWRAACFMAGADDLICITGSVYLAGQLRPLLLAPTSEPRAVASGS